MLEVMVIYGIFTDVAITSTILAFGIQIVLGVSYNILKIEVDMMNTIGEIDIQNVVFSWQVYYPRPQIRRAQQERERSSIRGKETATAVLLRIRWKSGLLHSGTVDKT